MWQSGEPARWPGACRQRRWWRLSWLGGFRISRVCERLGPWCIAGNDGAATQAFIAIINNHRLPRSDGALRLIKGQPQAITVDRLHPAHLIGLAVAHLGVQPLAGFRPSADPVELPGLE